MGQKELEEKKKKLETDWQNLQQQRQFLSNQLAETNRQLILYQRKEIIESQIREIDRQLSVLQQEFLELEKIKKAEEVKKEN